LPPVGASLIVREIALRSSSPAQSLSLALGPEPIPAPLPAFGVLHARHILKRSSEVAQSVGHAPDSKKSKPEQELKTLDEGEKDAGGIGDLFQVPGGAGLLGKLFQNLLDAARSMSGGGGPLGNSSATHRLRVAPRSASGGVYSTAKLVDDGASSEPKNHGVKYPEWDDDRRCYRTDWCTVEEQECVVTGDAPQMSTDRYGLLRPLARLGMGLDRYHRQAQGDEIDLDAVIEARVNGATGQNTSDELYIDSLRRRRDLSVLLLLDISGSVGQTAQGSERTVHQQQRAVAAALAIALHEIGDRVALYAFQSQGRSAVHLTPIKRFSDGIGGHMMGRLASLQPGAYSRLGAAIRHGTSVLAAEGGTSRRLLVVLSDGLAYDHGYELSYGAADARQSLIEARREGIGCLCLSIGSSTDTSDLRRVFGSAAHASFSTPDRVSERIGPLLRSAIRSAEVRRSF
jgi:nitric oxide reductase NorD protein